MFFGTVSHEGWCEAATEDKEFVGELRKLTAKWKIWTKDCFGIDENYLSYPDKAQR